jgi:hypothetical protein
MEKQCLARGGLSWVQKLQADSDNRQGAVSTRRYAPVSLAECIFPELGITISQRDQSRRNHHHVTGLVASQSGYLKASLAHEKLQAQLRWPLLQAEITASKEQARTIETEKQFRRRLEEEAEDKVLTRKDNRSALARLDRCKRDRAAALLDSAEDDVEFAAGEASLIKSGAQEEWGRERRRRAERRANGQGGVAP